MSLFGALNTAVSGLGAQSAAFSNIGDNVANSQTIGFKGTDTRFNDYLTNSTATANESGNVVATPSYQNNVQGTITQSSAPLAMAISGQGFFTVSQSVGTGANGQPVFKPEPQYTRAGDFQLNKDGYIVNGAGHYLNAWPVGATGNVNQAQLAPLQVSEANLTPVATTQLTLSANLPATPSTTPTAANPLVSQLSVYDALGTKQQLTLNWSQANNGAVPPVVVPNQWNVTISGPGAANANLGGIHTVTFANGLVTGVDGAVGVAGQPAQINIAPNFGSGAQAIALNLGTFGQASGLTQFNGTDLTVNSVTQNGASSGSFTGLSTDTNGRLTASYSNGQTRVVGQVPITTFADSNALQRQNNQAFTATPNSGLPLTQAAGAGAAGGLVTQSIESSNVDIAAQLSKVIVAQQAYSANAKLVTTADQMLQQTINMKQ